MQELILKAPRMGNALTPAPGLSIAMHVRVAHLEEDFNCVGMRLHRNSQADHTCKSWLHVGVLVS